MMSSAALRRDLRAIAPDSLLRSPRYSVDYGRAPGAAPAAIVRPKDERELRRILAFACARAIPTTVRGAGHSSNGQTLAPDGIVIANLLEEPPRPTLDAQKNVTCASGQTWRNLEFFLYGKRRASPVLTDVLEFTVGGTLSVGGFGVASLRHGLQVENVERLRLVLPDGEVAWCSADENADLFHLALTGCGAVGVISKAVMRTVPRPALTRIDFVAHGSFAELVESCGWLARAPSSGPDTFWGGRFPRLGSDETVGVYGTHVASEDAAPPPFVSKLGNAKTIVTPEYSFFCEEERKAGLGPVEVGSRRIWADYVFDHPTATRFAREVEGRLAKSTHMPWAFYLLVSRSTRAKTHGAFAPTGKNGFRVGIGLYFMPNENDAAAIAEAEAHHRWALARCVALKGRPYLYGWTRLDETQKTSLYGAAYRRMRALRKKRGWEHLVPNGPLVRAPEGAAS